MKVKLGKPCGTVRDDLGPCTCCSPVTTLCRYQCGAAEVYAVQSAVLLSLRRSPFEMFIGHGRLCVRVSVCVSVDLSLAAFPHYCTDPDVSWGNGRGCSLVVHYWADLQ